MASNSDNYEFAKSIEPQTIGAYTAYADKQYSSINDINTHFLVLISEIRLLYVFFNPHYLNVLIL